MSILMILTIAGFAVVKYVLSTRKGIEAEQRALKSGGKLVVLAMILLAMWLIFHLLTMQI